MKTTAQDPEAQTEGTYKKAEKIGESDILNMKIRYIGFDRRKVLRVIKPFTHDGVDYAPGQIFDWVGMGLKPYYVQRLYNRKVVRHITEDSKVRYPFRYLSVRKAPEAETATDTAETVENEAPEAETGEVAPEKTVERDGKAKFTKKGAIRHK